jgi:hypothetical protein
VTSLSWQTHPLTEEPWPKSAALFLAVGGAAAAAGLGFGHWGYGAFSALVLAASLSRYLLPTRYHLDRERVEIRHLGRPQHRPWQQVRRVDVQADGVFLSPFSRPHRLDSFRGCFLRFGAQREAVLSFVRERVDGRAA